MGSSKIAGKTSVTFLDGKIAPVYFSYKDWLKSFLGAKLWEIAWNVWREFLSRYLVDSSATMPSYIVTKMGGLQAVLCNYIILRWSSFKSTYVHNKKLAPSHLRGCSGTLLAEFFLWVTDMADRQGDYASAVFSLRSTRGLMPQSSQWLSHASCRTSILSPLQSISKYLNLQTK